MKTLQNNFTTPEQSKRLLELGVPAWTANIMFDKNRRMYELIETEDEGWVETQRTLFYNGGAIPCWSVGRLIEILAICCENPMFFIDRTIVLESGMIDYCVRTFANSVKLKIIDFSKLEE